MFFPGSGSVPVKRSIISREKPERMQKFIRTDWLLSAWVNRFEQIFPELNRGTRQFNRITAAIKMLRAVVFAVAMFRPALRIAVE